MIRCTSAGSASPAEHGGEEERQRRLVSMRAAEDAPQSGPVWAHSGALMTLPPLANCCVLAARWNVNRSTCDDELRRGAAQLAAPPPTPNRVYLGHNINIWTCAGMHRGGATPKHINLLSFQCFPVCVHAAGESGRNH